MKQELRQNGISFLKDKGYEESCKKYCTLLFIFADSGNIDIFGG